MYVPFSYPSRGFNQLFNYRFSYIVYAVRSLLLQRCRSMRLKHFPETPLFGCGLSFEPVVRDVSCPTRGTLATSRIFKDFFFSYYWQRVVRVWSLSRGSALFARRKPPRRSIWKKTRIVGHDDRVGLGALTRPYGVDRRPS